MCAEELQKTNRGWKKPVAGHPGAVPFKRCCEIMGSTFLGVPHLHHVVIVVGCDAATAEAELDAIDADDPKVKERQDDRKRPIGERIPPAAQQQTTSRNCFRARRP